jgi:sensor histidine kinase YesM
MAGTVITILLRQLQFSWTYSLTDATISASLLVGMVWMGMLAVNNYPTKVGVFIYSIIIGIGAGVIAWSLDKFALNWWFRGEENYLSWLKESQLSRVVISILACSWVITLTAINKRTREVEDQFKNMTDAATLHREAELFKLRQQLQPHFLYNSLNSINALIMIMPEKAQEMVGKLSDFLRNSVKREGREQIPIDEELEYIEAYLAIEAVRFGDRLKVKCEKAHVDGATIPPFLLQPILENAIKFGLYGKTGTVDIQLQIKLEGDYLVLTIVNPYDPENRPPSGTGFGLTGIERRLYLLYARMDLLEARPGHTAEEQDEKTFTTILKIPQHHV